jgi:hypothetical protein
MSQRSGYGLSQRSSYCLRRGPSDVLCVTSYLLRSGMPKAIGPRVTSGDQTGAIRADRAARLKSWPALIGQSWRGPPRGISQEAVIAASPPRPQGRRRRRRRECPPPRLPPTRCPASSGTDETDETRFRQFCQSLLTWVANAWYVGIEGSSHRPRPDGLDRRIEGPGRGPGETRPARDPRAAAARPPRDPRGRGRSARRRPAPRSGGGQSGPAPSRRSGRAAFISVPD